MAALLIDINLFGANERGFLNAIKHYSDIKAGYDATISSYNNGAYTVRSLAPDKGTVPVRNDISFQRDILSMITELEPGMEAIGFKFFVPLKKGFQVSVNAELTSWNGSEVLARVSDVIGSYVAHGSPENKGNLVTFDTANANEYAYLPIVLSGVPTDELNDPKYFLQEKIRRWKDKTTDISKQLFILRVWQMAWPIGIDIDAVTSEDFEVRDDSIILEIKD